MISTPGPGVPIPFAPTTAGVPTPLMPPNVPVGPELELGPPETPGFADTPVPNMLLPPGVKVPLPPSEADPLTSPGPGDQSRMGLSENDGGPHVSSFPPGTIEVEKDRGTCGRFGLKSLPSTPPFAGGPPGWPSPIPPTPGDLGRPAPTAPGPGLTGSDDLAEGVVKGPEMRARAWGCCIRCEKEFLAIRLGRSVGTAVAVDD